MTGYAPYFFTACVWSCNGWLFVRQFGDDFGLGHHRVELVAQLDLDLHLVAAAALDELVDNLTGEERGVAGEGRVAVLRSRVRDEAPLTGPRRDVVDDP